MNPIKKTALAGTAMLALGNGAAHAQPGNRTAAPKVQTAADSELKRQVDELREQLKALQTRSQPDALSQSQVQELQKQVKELRDQLKSQAEAANGWGKPIPETASEDERNSRTPATKADVQGLRTDLENYKYDNSRLFERNIPSVTRNTKIGGSLIAKFSYQNPGVLPSTTSGTTVPAATRSDGFDAITAGLNFTGTLYRDYQEGKNLTYRLAFQTATNFGSTAQVNSVGQSIPNGSQFNLTDGYIRYSYQPTSGNLEDALGTVTVGQQVVPFGIDAQALDPEVRPVINSSQFVAGLGNVGTRQLGLLWSGDYDPYVDYTNNYRSPLLTYSLGLFNGTGSNKSDNNSMKDVAARLLFSLPVDYSSWFRQLQIGISGYRGDGVTGTYAAADPTTAVATGRGISNRYGFDATWTHLPYSITYEIAYGRDTLTGAAAAAAGEGIKRSRGQYVNFGYTWGEQFLASSRALGKFDDWWPKSYQAFLRFDAWDPNTNAAAVTNADLNHYITTVGLNVFFAETTRFQINYLRTRNQLGPVQSAALPEYVNQIQMQLSATF